MKTINDLYTRKSERPIKVVQFGEGNFLRAFVDYAIDIANEEGKFSGDVAIVKPIAFGNLDRFDAQDNLYTVVLRGKENGKVINSKRVITSVQKAVDPFKDYDGYMALASLETLEFVVSNTTEAGIVFDPSDTFDGENGLPNTYPGKLTKFLYARYTAFSGADDKGLIMLPVELIENNGGKLKECVLSLIDLWKLPEAFRTWVENSCVFCSTLVDRIVTGWPREEATAICDELGYTDNLLDVGEPFALWVIESDKDISDRFTIGNKDFKVVFTDNQKPYRERKVRVLNGAHTSTVLMAYLAGLDIVRECMEDADIRPFMEKLLYEEIVPQVKLPREDVMAFASAVFERFENPFIRHALLSISLNSVSKWKARVLPSFVDCVNANGKLPSCITFSFAALLAFYTASEKGDSCLISKRPNGDEYSIRDDAAVLDFFAENSGKPTNDFVRLTASNEAFWGMDLTKFDGFVDTVTAELDDIRTNGAREALRHMMNA